MRLVSHHDRTRELFQRFGYDPDDPVPRDEDGQRVIPERLLDALAAAPYINPRHISRIRWMKAARQVAAMREARARGRWLFAYRADRDA